MRLILHAPNISQGGGGALLTALLEADVNGLPRLVTVDERFVLPRCLRGDVVVKRVVPTLAARLGAEWRLRGTTRAEDIVLCCGNLPPLFRLPSKVILFLGNRLLVEDIALNEYPLRSRLRLLAERRWLRSRLRNVHRVLVQTATMQHKVKAGLGVVADVLPFVKDGRTIPRHQKPKERNATRFDFLYVASGEPHKNHVHLIEAWQLLAAEGIWPKLCLTLSPKHHAKLCRHIADTTAKHGLNITNRGTVPAGEIQDLYEETRALIYPSTLESLGLPLIEARLAGLPVIASELDYVRDLLDPEQTFDPSSPMSIARAVKRFMRLDDNPTPILNAVDFVKNIVAK